MRLARQKVRVADEAWIATALMHSEQPDRADFRVDEILERAQKEHLTEHLRPGVCLHVTYYCVANNPTNSGRYRMLFSTGTGNRRLFRRGDSCHENRTGKITPERDEIPSNYHYLLDWYDKVYSSPPEEKWLEGIFQLRGSGKELWADEDPDAYVRRLREGWD